MTASPTHPLMSIATPIRARTSRLGRVAGALALQRVPRTQLRRVLFNSFNGRYSDNPRAIYEELARRGDARTHVWISSAPGQLPAGPLPVAPFSWPYLRQVGRAGFVVSNLQMPNNFQKRRGQTYLQTWHGTPLKRIGFDNPRWKQNPEGFRKISRDFARWDYLISPNAFSTEIFRRAFAFEGEILETGYPRNDVLSAPDRDERRRRARAQLGIEEGVTAVLYAPTWRDDVQDEHGRLRFSLTLDLERMQERLGDGHVVLLRLHYLIASRLGQLGTGAIDVSEHPDISDLYLAADVLLTDYSSAMFDFAVTRKPILFFAYDLPSYRDQLRGFYFDFEAEAPGPLCETTDEVIAALEDVDGVAAAHAERYAAFHERFCALEDGHAAARVVDRVFAGAA